MENLCSILEHKLAEKRMNLHCLLPTVLITLQSTAPPWATIMSFTTVGHAKKFLGAHTTDHTVFANRAINFENDLATTNCLIISLAEFPVMVFISPQPNSQFPNPTNVYFVLHGIKWDKLIKMLCGFKDVDLTQPFSRGALWHFKNNAWLCGIIQYCRRFSIMVPLSSKRK